MLVWARDDGVWAPIQIHWAAQRLQWAVVPPNRLLGGGLQCIRCGQRLPPRRKQPDRQPGKRAARSKGTAPARVRLQGRHRRWQQGGGGAKGTGVGYFLMQGRGAVGLSGVNPHGQ